MGWFDEQIRERKEYDSAVFEDSFLKIAGSVLGQKMSLALEEDSIKAKDAIERVLKYYKIRSHEIPENIKDTNEQLEYLLRPHGIMRRNVVLEKGWYKDAYGAMLGTRKDTGNVVALIPDKFQGYHFFDDTTGKEVHFTGENEGMIEKEAVAFYIPFPLEKLGMRSLLKYIVGTISGQDIFMFAAAALCVTLLGLIMPVLNKWLFSVVIYAQSVQALMATAVFMMCLIFSSLLIGVVKSLISVRINTKLHISVEAAVMMRILSLPAVFFKDYSAGELANRASYISGLCDLIVNSVLSLGLTGIFSLIYLVQIFAFAPALVVPAVAMILSMVIISILSALWQIRISRKQMELASKESGMTYSLISGIQKIKLSGAEKRAFAKWGTQYAKATELTYNPPIFLKVNAVLNTAVGLIGVLIIYYAAVKSGVTVSDFYAFNTSYGMVSGAVATLAGMALSIAKMKPMLEMCAPIMESVPEVAEEKSVVERLSGGIELNHVSFRYRENMPLILDDLSLKIRPGQYVAIVGSTGCGKSTLMRIMLGFEQPQKGAVFYDGKDLSSMDLRSLRRKIGTVMQNGRLFQGDIYSNITISAPWLNMDAAWEAAELSGVADDIRHMPMGMFTLISEGQGGISGGQRQRLMIARAIAPKPRVLMFDEATSALDNLTQKKVSQALENLKCTRIVIAHRLSTIRQCDRIIVLDKGHIVEDGTYEELIENSGFFAELVERQRIDVGA
ncbi:MAG: NHLP bacteriocin export ABC transporter permease/ATPase subunit [Lachnospiraceae bacterium]|nr:NHLP bacteriocin export ABC transporter permease/ATPase subunit [Lachnospiraceae bacterium]